VVICPQLRATRGTIKKIKKKKKKRAWKGKNTQIGALGRWTLCLSNPRSMVCKRAEPNFVTRSLAIPSSYDKWALIACVNTANLWNDS